MNELSEMQREWLMRRAFQSAPEEACGFLMSDGKFIEINNSHQYPYMGFQMSRDDLMKKVGTQELIDNIVAIWHTHPGGSLDPSNADMGYMFEASRSWTYIIATKDDVRVWPAKFFAPQDDSFWKAFS